MDNLFNSILTIPNTLVLAGISWLVKSSYTSYKREIISITTLERVYAENLKLSHDNLQLMNLWDVQLKSGGLFSCNFGKFTIDNKSHLHLSDMELINLIVKTNYFQKCVNQDLSNLYISYCSIIARFEDGKISEDRLVIYFSSISQTIEAIREQMDVVSTEMIKSIARLRLVWRAKGHSVYGYLDRLNMNIFPKVTSKKMDEEIVSINKDLRKV